MEYNKTFTTALHRIEYQHPAHLYIWLIQGVNDVYLKFVFNNKVKRTRNNWITGITRHPWEYFLRLFLFLYKQWRFKQKRKTSIEEIRSSLIFFWFIFCIWYKINKKPQILRLIHLKNFNSYTLFNCIHNQVISSTRYTHGRSLTFFGFLMIQRGMRNRGNARC